MRPGVEWLIDELLTWCSLSEVTERLHRACGVTLNHADVHHLATVLRDLEDEEMQRAEEFAWEFGDLSPWEFGSSGCA